MTGSSSVKTSSSSPINNKNKTSFAHLKPCWNQHQKMCTRSGSTGQQSDTSVTNSTSTSAVPITQSTSIGISRRQHQRDQHHQHRRAPMINDGDTVDVVTAGAGEGVDSDGSSGAILSDDVERGATRVAFDDGVNNSCSSIGHHDHHQQQQQQHKRGIRSVSTTSRLLGESDDERRQHNKTFSKRTAIFAMGILLVGFAVSAAFLTVGILGQERTTNDAFIRQASELVNGISTAWHDYQVAGLWIQDTCRSSADQKETYLRRGICSRNDFDDLYEHLASTGLVVQAICWVVNATHEERIELETEAYEYYGANFPNFTYNGMVGFQPDSTNPNGVSVQPRDVQDFYYAVHYCLPFTGFNLAAVDFDIRTSEPRRVAVEQALNTGEPALTARVVLLGDEQMKDGYSVILMHPGEPTSRNPNLQPNEVGLVVVRVRSLLSRAVSGLLANAAVGLIDTTDASDPLYMGGINVHVLSNNQTLSTEFVREDEMKSIRESAHLEYTDTVEIANRQWQIVIVDTYYNPDLKFVILGGVMIAAASCFLAAWFVTNTYREKRIQKLRRQAEQEKSALIVENAEKAALAERELNDFIAHEVRNPLAAAISACSFVSSHINEEPPMATEESKTSVREDVSIISSSLQYMNDLLRNMLDMHRVAHHQLKVELSPADLKRDVLDPIATMLYRRGDMYEVLVECPEQMMIMTDRIRLKQVILNLANNSRKFVTQGFIRVRAEVVNGRVHIFVEDSGPGIPPSKRDHLFEKFQESLDSLNQGTGIGLSLCKDLTNLMNGDIWLDESYDSGVSGFPGTRFVIDLNAAPLELNSSALDRYEENMRRDGQTKGSGPLYLKKLPEKLKILFVDDDFILRKLFSRSVKRVVPEYEVSEASNGETALLMTTENDYDIIFVDQYMASIEKQLLGTETVREMRSRGVESVICGLSANDCEEQFINAGANAFMFKPFPCETDQLASELVRVLYGSSELGLIAESTDEEV